MDPLQLSALNALAPFIALAKTATSPRAASDLISQATSAPNTYVFAELLETPNIQALKGAEPQHNRWLRLLEIFSWGTWADYKASQDLPELNAAQSTKLRLLSVLTLARIQANLTYPALQAALELPTVAALEALLTDAIYSGLVTAKLNPQQQRVDIASVAPLRDLEPGSVPELAKIMELWEKKCAQVLAGIQGRIEDVKRSAKERETNNKEWEEKYEALLEETKNGKGGKREGDDLESMAEGKKSTRFGALGMGRKLG